MKLQLGYDNFGHVRTKGLNFVDKTLFIKEVLDDKNTEVSVITRPRRFGKTFNLSMLHYFLAEEVYLQKTAGLFDELKISQLDNGSYMQYQGKFPVIFVSFKEAKNKTFEAATASIRTAILELFRNHSYLEGSAKLSSKEKEVFNHYLDNNSRIVEDLKASLRFLCELIYKHTSKKVFLLIDEYDTPIQSGYLEGYYDEIVDLMRGMFGAALKTSPYLERAVITGILRVAKESLFSGLNNVMVYSLLQKKYSQHFGFTEEEVSGLLKQSDLVDKESEVRRWYNGYVFGSYTVYNPWSIANYVNSGGEFRPYWINTSGNDLIRDIVTKSNLEFKEQFEALLQDKTVSKVIDVNMVFGDLIKNANAAWSLLMMSGYLKATATTIDANGKTICECAIPNWEVKTIYCDTIQEWLGNGNGEEWYRNFLSYLLEGNIEKFIANFGQVLAQTISVYDMAHNPEAFYHGFMLGLAASLDPKRYELKSNKESGAGRYDIAIIPKDISQLAIIFEIKSITSPKGVKQNLEEFLENTLTQEAKKAVEQINHKQYVQELEQRGHQKMLKIGFAFSGKDFKVATELLA